MIANLLLVCLGLVVPALTENVPFIIGGTTVGSDTDHPWQCSLQYFGSHSCGASIISSTWLVTAAHCVQSWIGSFSVKCGSLRYADGTKRTIKRIIDHEFYGYGRGAYPNDIAVIELSSALPMSDTIKAIQMASTDPAGNFDCHITGWGYTGTGVGGIYPVLMEARVNVYTNTYCKTIWGSGSINDGHVCIGDATNGRGSCNGDSGGPLVCNINGQYELVGATSWGIMNCYTSYPSVYSRISYFRQWIKDNTGV